MERFFGCKEGFFDRKEGFSGCKEGFSGRMEPFCVCMAPTGRRILLAAEEWLRATAAALLEAVAALEAAVGSGPLFAWSGVRQPLPPAGARKGVQTRRGARVAL